MKRSFDVELFLIFFVPANGMSSNVSTSYHGPACLSTDMQGGTMHYPRISLNVGASTKVRTLVHIINPIVETKKQTVYLDDESENHCCDHHPNHREEKYVLEACAHPQNVSALVYIIFSLYNTVETLYEAFF